MATHRQTVSRSYQAVPVPQRFSWENRGFLIHNPAATAGFSRKARELHAPSKGCLGIGAGQFPKSSPVSIDSGGAAYQPPTNRAAGKPFLLFHGLAARFGALTAHGESSLGWGGRVRGTAVPHAPCQFPMGALAPWNETRAWSFGLPAKQSTGRAEWKVGVTGTSLMGRESRFASHPTGSVPGAVETTRGVARCRRSRARCRVAGASDRSSRERWH